MVLLLADAGVVVFIANIAAVEVGATVLGIPTSGVGAGGVHHILVPEGLQAGSVVRAVTHGDVGVLGVVNDLELSIVSSIADAGIVHLGADVDGDAVT